MFHLYPRTARFAFRLLAVVALLWGLALPGQRTVNVLRAPVADRGTRVADAPADAAAADFTFERNLIFFEAEVDGRTGHFILDTGAPSLVMNTRGAETTGSSYTGLGSGGQVSLTDQRIGTFAMPGRQLENFWALGIDLRDMEARTERRIDGFVGYDLVNAGELRIDYGRRNFQLLPSARRPQHAGAAPRAVLRFTLVDHLPVVQVKIGGKRYRFAIDTGAGLNLLADWAAEALPTVAGERSVNVQGLDGTPMDYPCVSVDNPAALGGGERLELVRADLSHLQDPGKVQLAGILGSSFLSRYVVGIDYRRQKVYLW